MQSVVAELMSLLVVVAILKRQIKSDDPLAVVAKDRTILEKIEQVALAKCKIRLMINPEKEDHRTLNDTIDSVYSYVISLEQTDVLVRLRPDIERIAEQACAIFRAEWIRVKRGE